MAKKEASKKNTLPEPNTIIKDTDPEIVKIEDVVTPKEKIIIKKELVYSQTWWGGKSRDDFRQIRVVEGPWGCTDTKDEDCHTFHRLTCKGWDMMDH